MSDSTSIPAFSPRSSELLPTPTKAEVRAVIPDHCFETDLKVSLGYAAFSLITTLIPAVLAWRFLPLTAAWAPAWVLYALVVGSLAQGTWVIAHECGHGAFSRNKTIQDTVGFVFHSALLVPYFSWQRSHAIHHAKTNHMIDGETHVPPFADGLEGRLSLLTRRLVGPVIYPMISSTLGLLLGWPMYLLFGISGGHSRGTTNHFWPRFPFANDLFPDRWARKVLYSTVGVASMIGLLVWWGMAAGSFVPVLALYGGPYLVVNAWLVLYTWLHHTGEDVPHYEGDSWNYVRGAFCSVDRPYGKVFNLLHHNIGSTHAVHHLFARVPHYRAVEATEAVKAAFPEHYRFDPTPVPVAFWRVARDCVAVAPSNTAGEWRFTRKPHRADAAV